MDGNDKFTLYFVGMLLFFFLGFGYILWQSSLDELKIKSELQKQTRYYDPVYEPDSNIILLQKSADGRYWETVDTVRAR